MAPSEYFVCRNTTSRASLAPLEGVGRRPIVRRRPLRATPLTYLVVLQCPLRNRFLLGRACLTATMHLAEGHDVTFGPKLSTSTMTLLKKLVASRQRLKLYSTNLKTKFGVRTLRDNGCCNTIVVNQIAVVYFQVGVDTTTVSKIRNYRTVVWCWAA